MPDDLKIYEALVIPDEALDKGGLEILRAGLVDDELYVTARRAFKDAATWGEVLADITRRLARIQADEGDVAQREALAAIMSAYAAALGAPVVAAPRRAAGRTSGRKSTRKMARKSTHKSVHKSTHKSARKPARSSAARRKPAKRKAR